MSNKRYTDEFKIEVIKQVTEQGHSPSDVATRLGITTSSIYNWIKKFGSSNSKSFQQSNQQSEINQLKKELSRVTEERDILKKAAAYFAKESQ